MKALLPRGYQDACRASAANQQAQQHRSGLFAEAPMSCYLVYGVTMTVAGAQKTLVGLAATATTQGWLTIGIATVSFFGKSAAFAMQPCLFSCTRPTQQHRVLTVV